MKAIIAAAGRGRRILPFSKDRPKPLLLIRKRPFLEYTLDNLIAEGIKEIVIITGYLSEQFDYLLKPKYKKHIIFIKNEDYSETENLDSLYLAKDYIKEGFIFINADVIFSKTLLRKLLQYRKQNICVVEKGRELSKSVMKVRVAGNKLVGIGRSLMSGNGRAIGLYKFSTSGAKEYFEIIKSLKVNGKKGFQIEKAISIFIRKYPIHMLETGKYAWYEIDEKKDLLKAEKIINRIAR